jgi:hypothetical protein
MGATHIHRHHQAAVNLVLVVPLIGSHDRQYAPLLLSAQDRFGDDAGLAGYLRIEEGASSSRAA